jgi:hypothetical protein
MKSRILCSALLLSACAILFPMQEAKADTIVYAGGYFEEYGTLDLNTGVFTILGNPGDQAGFGELGGKLYSGDGEGDTNSVNPANGSDALIGTNSTTYDTFGSTTTGLYAVSHPTGGNPFLTYSVNPTTGIATLLGSTGQDINPNGGTAGLSAGSNTLYWTWTSGPHSILYSLNTTTGFANAIGDTGAFIGALVYVNGTLYGEDVTDDEIDTLNLSTGLATPTGVTVSGAPRSDLLYGMAPLLASTPEPSSMFILVAMIAAMMIYRLRATRRSVSERSENLR